MFMHIMLRSNKKVYYIAKIERSILVEQQQRGCTKGLQGCKEQLIIEYSYESGS